MAITRMGMSDEQVLDYAVHDDGVSWTLVSSSQQRAQDARYTLVPEGDTTRVTFELTVDPTVPLLDYYRAELKTVDAVGELDDDALVEEARPRVGPRGVEARALVALHVGVIDLEGARPPVEPPRAVVEPGPEERAFLDGQLHVTLTMPLAKIPGYRESNSPFFHNDPLLSVYMYRCNTKKKPFDNPLVREAVAAFGRLDVIVNNAGIYRGGKLAHEFAEDDLDACWTVNVKGTWFGCQEAIKQFLKQGGGGNIVNLVLISFRQAVFSRSR